MKNLLEKFKQEQKTADNCGFYHYVVILNMDFVKLNHYAHMTNLARQIGCCEEVYNF